MATIYSARKAHGEADSEWFMSRSWAKYELEKGYEDYLKKGKVIHCFCHKKTGHNELFEDLIELQQEMGFDLVLTYYKNDGTNDYIIERRSYNGCIDKEIVNGNEFDFARLEPFAVIDADLCIGNPEACIFNQYFEVIRRSYPNFVLWGHLCKIMNDFVRLASIRGEVWGGNTHNKMMSFFNAEGEIKKITWSVFTNCNVKICKRKFVKLKKSLNDAMNDGTMYLYDNSRSLYNVDSTSDIPCDYKGKLSIPPSGLFALNPFSYKHLGNINGKKIDEAVGLYGFDKMLCRNKKGVLQKVTLGIKDGKIGASRCVIELL